MPVYLTIDFESTDKKGTWFSYAVILAEYPSGKILSMRQSGCNRPKTDYDEKTLKFWNKNLKAHNQMTATYKTNKVEHEELCLCKYISQILAEYPTVYLISDNPQYDIKLVDNILAKYDFDPISMRNDKLYFQCICTWSYRLGVKAILNQKRIDINALESNLPDVYRELNAYFGPRHTPQADCARILRDHFRLMDVIENI